MNISFATPFVFWMKIWENALSGRDLFDTNDPMTASMKKRSAAADADVGLPTADDVKGIMRDDWLRGQTGKSKLGVTAIARLIFENLPDIDGDEADWLFYKEDFETAAKQIIALTAAAGVEAETWDAPVIRALTNRIIERCAQVVNSYDGSLMDSTRKNLIAAIRALKDEGLPTAEDVRGILKEEK